MKFECHLVRLSEVRMSTYLASEPVLPPYLVRAPHDENTWGVSFHWIVPVAAMVGFTELG